MICPLCKNTGTAFFNEEFFDCANCRGLFRTGQSFLSEQEEKARYETHNNDVTDEGYRNFVKPVTSWIFSKINRDQKGLDFGCGTGPVISEVITQEGYSIKQYDPFFANDPSLLSGKYDYIVCCEVIEHFHDPAGEFKKLYEMLNPGGKLICMTHIYSDEIDFAKWYYKNDPTHVFIYRNETIKHIARKYDFKNFSIEDRLIIFEK